MEKLILFYDGDCPFCQHFSKILKAKSCVKLEICNAREDLRWHELDSSIKLDDGVIAIYKGILYQGVDAINLLHQICNYKDFPSKLQRVLFLNKFLGKLLYGLLKLLRRGFLFFKK